MPIIQSVSRLRTRQTRWGESPSFRFAGDRAVLSPPARTVRRSVHLTVRIQDSQSWHKGSIPLPTTTIHYRKKILYKVFFLHNQPISFLLHVYYRFMTASILFITLCCIQQHQYKTFCSTFRLISSLLLFLED